MKDRMATKMYVNLPVKDLDQSIDFFTRLGFAFNPQFTDSNATCMIIGPDSFVMLLVESFFKTFTPKKICDARRQTEVLICLSCDSREQVSDMVGQAIASGGTTPHPPQDHGFMYQHGFQDLDGHLWELMYVDAVAISPSDSALS
jgi:predicted lactoylglutathione lyase